MAMFVARSGLGFLWVLGFPPTEVDWSSELSPSVNSGCISGSRAASLDPGRVNGPIDLAGVLIGLSVKSRSIVVESSVAPDFTEVKKLLDFAECVFFFFFLKNLRCRFFFCVCVCAFF